MRLKNRKSYMTSLPEGKPPKERKARIIQTLYLLSIAGLFFYLLQTGFNRWQHFEGSGLIEVEKKIVSSRFGGRITRISVKEGEDLQAGDPIAKLEPARVCKAKKDPSLERLQDDIALKLVRLSVLREHLRRLSREADILQASNTNKVIDEQLEIILRRALEVGRVGSTASKSSEAPSRDRQLARETQKIKTELALLKKEISLKKRRVKTLEKRGAKIRVLRDCLSETIIAPFSARVQAVQLHENEFARRGEAIVTLVARRAPVYIEAIFENKIMPYLTPEKRLEVVFPDGWRSQGRIETVSSPDYALSPHERDSPLKNGKRVRARVLPLNEDAGIRWLRYDRMEVKVRGKR